MSWLKAIGMGAGALLGGPTGAMIGGSLGGGVEGEQERQRIKNENLAQAEITKYSPWTGMTGKLQRNNASAFGGALQGGVEGYMLGNMADKAGWLKGSAPTTNLAGTTSVNPFSVNNANPSMNNSWLSRGPQLGY